MDIKLYNKIINDTNKYTIYLNLYFQGEPLLHPQITEFIRKASENKIYTTLSTNAQLLDDNMCKNITKSGLSRIIISFDGFSQKVYETYRRGGYVENVKQGILKLIAARKKFGFSTPIIVAQILAFGHNKHEIQTIQQWCKDAGVDKLEIKTAQINDFGDGTMKPAKEKSRYQPSSEGEYLVSGKAYNHCWRQWSSAVFTWNGLMVPCCYDKNAEKVLGNISNDTFNEILKNPEDYNFKQRILSKRNGIEMCRDCPEGRHWLIG